MFGHLPELIVYARHPQCLHNVNADGALERGIPNKESPLTDLGRMQRDVTAAYLRDRFEEFDAVFTSTYARSQEIPLAAQFKTPIIEEALLDERSMGAMHRLTRAELRKEYPGEMKKLKEQLKGEGYYYYRAPGGGETCPDVEARQELFLRDKERFKGTRSILVSGHGISGLCLKKVLLDASVKDWHSWGRLKNASVTIFEKQKDEFECTQFNYIPWEGLLEDGGGTEA